MGVAQTEIEFIAELQPDLQRQLVIEAIKPFFDEDLDRRLREPRLAWERAAQEEFEQQLDSEQLATDDVQAELDALNEF